jgi:hypothetical protein
MRRVRDRAVRTLGTAGERVGLSITPAHFYGAVANRTDLRRRSDWRRPFVPADVHWDLDDQERWLRQIVNADTALTAEARRSLAALGRVGSGYGYVEEAVLYSYIRSKAPKRIVEIGSGHTTAVMRAASLQNEADGRVRSTMTAYDPYSKLPDEIRADVTVHDIALQDATGEVAAELEAGDLLFIDSSHAVKSGSEVHILYLDLIPRLAPGVDLHIHDIYLPFLHHPALLAEDLWDWQETALLAALLSGHQRLSITCCLSGLAHERTSVLAELIDGYQPRRTDDGGLFIDSEGHFPASCWLSVS